MPNILKDIIRGFLLEEHYKQTTNKRHNNFEQKKQKNVKENESGNKKNEKQKLNEVISHFLAKHSK